jgi:hypothetical protein
MKADRSILRKLIRMTHWFEKLILRLAPGLPPSYDVICLRLEPTVRATANVCPIVVIVGEGF